MSKTDYNLTNALSENGKLVQQLGNNNKFKKIVEKLKALYGKYKIWFNLGFVVIAAFAAYKIFKKK